MKKLAILLALCLLMGAACAEAAFQPLHFSFWTDAANGYEWTCEYDDNGVLATPIQEFVDQGDGAGSQEFYFGVQKAGKAEIFFNYGVNWDVAVPEQTAIYTVIADESGASTVRSAHVYSDDGVIEIALPGNTTTGWGWSYRGEGDGAGIVTLLSEDYTSFDDKLDGAGGVFTYQLKVDKPGETVLLFNHSNLWDPNAAAQESYAVIVTANDDMEISISVES